jgi:DNA polymerase-3 subunit epsilon
MRQIALDTETTGISTDEGHRIIEIGCIEIENRRITGNEFHCYLNPEREIDEGATRVHGLTLEKLSNEPLFKEVAKDFLNFVSGAELIIHNAAFDVGFLNKEISLLEWDENSIEDHALVMDTLKMAREMHPGKKNSLDALCTRYEIDRSMRQVHGALIDADLLAKVYLAMTGGQDALDLDQPVLSSQETQTKNKENKNISLKVQKASIDELSEHEDFLSMMKKNGECHWHDFNED